MKKKKKSLVRSIYIVFTLLTVVPIIAAIFYFSNITSKQMNRAAINTVNSYAKQYENEISSTMQSLKNIFYSLESNKTIQKAMQDERYNFKMYTNDITKSINASVLYNAAWDNKCIKSIYLFKDSNHYHSVLRDGLYDKVSDRIVNIYKEFINDSSVKTLFSSTEEGNYSYYLIDYKDINTLNTLGKIVIELDNDKLLNLESLNNIYLNSTVLLSDLDGNMFFPKQSNEYEKYIKGREKIEKNYIEINEEKFYHTRRIINNMNIKIDIFIPKSEIYDEVENTIKIFIMDTVILIIVILIIGRCIFKYFSKPINETIKVIDSFGEGNLDIRMKESEYKETNIIVNSFNNMADNIEGLYTEIYEKKILLREAEYQNLESQINPHFIFNVLETVNMHCMEKQQLHTCKIISTLAQLIRSNVVLRNKQKITLQQELQYVNYYLDLQKERFKTMLEYSISIEDDELLQLFIPKLIIQPLVENSVVHGIENNENGGFVNIMIWEEEDLYIKVEDNGVGFDTSKLDLNQNIISDKHNNMAIQNISKRIKLICGEEYGLEIKSDIGKGTSIIVNIPIDHIGVIKC